MTITIDNLLDSCR